MKWIFAILFSACLAQPAFAQMGVFQTEAMAKLHCPNDTVVWLDFTKRRYYTEKQRLYGRGRTASFVCREEARKSGYKRSVLGRR